MYAQKSNTTQNLTSKFAVVRCVKEDTTPDILLTNINCWTRKIDLYAPKSTFWNKFGVEILETLTASTHKFTTRIGNNARKENKNRNALAKIAKNKIKITIFSLLVRTMATIRASLVTNL